MDCNTLPGAQGRRRPKKRPRKPGGARGAEKGLLSGAMTGFHPHLDYARPIKETSGANGPAQVIAS
jgi:hypothetical protein